MSRSRGRRRTASIWRRFFSFPPLTLPTSRMALPLLTTIASVWCNSPARPNLGSRCRALKRDLRRSYTILTIEKLTARGIGPLSFLIGADAFKDIRSWYRWKDVVASWSSSSSPGPARFGKHRQELWCMNWLDCSYPNRRRIFAAQLMRGDAAVPVPEPVLRYIREHGLYTLRVFPAYHEYPISGE